MNDNSTCSHAYLPGGLCPACHGTEQEDEEVAAQRALLSAVLAYARFQQGRGQNTPFTVQYDPCRREAALDQRFSPDEFVRATLIQGS